MKSAPAHRPASPWKAVALTVLGLAITGTGTVYRLYKLGIVDLSYFQREPDRRGLVGVPLCSRPIPPYTRVTRDFILDSKTGLPKMLYLRPEVAEGLGVITDYKEVIGRVISHEKPVDFAFKEEDFLPKGTRPGLVAGIPAGKRAMVFDATKIQGIHSLKVGDRLDILATVPIDLQVSSSPGSSSGVVSGLGVGFSARRKHATAEVLVQNAALVAPVTTRVVPVASSSLTQGTVTRTKPIQEAVIAVDPEEIAPLTEAIAVEANIFCVPRSGLPDDPPASLTPAGVDPAENVAIVETLIGGRREVIFIPKAPRPKERARSSVRSAARPVAEVAQGTPPGPVPATGRSLPRIP